METVFTSNIKLVLLKHFGKNADDVFEKSQLIQYINQKTRSANKGSKARSSFNALYSIYTLVEDYIAHNYHVKGDYSIYEGAKYTQLLKRARTLPFGSTVQNHSFNNRTNDEFRKYDKSLIPILRDTQTKHYWINENLLKVKTGKTNTNIAKVIIEIIDEYAKTKQDSFQRFVKTCEELQEFGRKTPKKVESFIIGLLAPNVDARLFEIVSYSILKYFYHDQQIIWGFEMDKLNTEKLKLYKTGRTNANDGGIDFVMKPLGRFFQVTETLDFKKYFLDIDKIQKYPITFVIKSTDPTQDLLKRIRDKASKTYSIKTIVNRYMDCIEEVINIPTLNDRFSDAVKQGYLNKILDEIVTQSKIEFNYEFLDKEAE
ncbi:MAG: restriction endonuclease [Bacteroidales bacterium]|nr:MAG: restriction endonuclease [Bacteroidales bacterium]